MWEDTTAAGLGGKGWPMPVVAQVRRGAGAGTDSQQEPSPNVPSRAPPAWDRDGGRGLRQGLALLPTAGKEAGASCMAETLPVLPVCLGSLALPQGRGAQLGKPSVQPQYWQALRPPAPH